MKEHQDHNDQEEHKSTTTKRNQNHDNQEHLDHNDQEEPRPCQLIGTLNNGGLGGKQKHDDYDKYQKHGNQKECQEHVHQKDTISTSIRRNTKTMAIMMNIRTWQSKGTLIT